MLAHFERLRKDFPLIEGQVDALDSPNPEDDRPIKFAIVGFCFHRPAESWGREEFEFVAQPRREVAAFDAAWVEFTCLVSGYLLGLYQAGRCTHAELALFEAQLPGLMWLDAEQFTNG